MALNRTGTLTSLRVPGDLRVVEAAAHRSDARRMEISGRRRSALSTVLALILAVEAVTVVAAAARTSATPSGTHVLPAAAPAGLVLAESSVSARFVAMAHSNDAAGGGDYDNYLYAFSSIDGVNWTRSGTADGTGSILPGSTYRDPSVIRRGSTWRIVATGEGAGQAFGLLSSTDFATGWTRVSPVSTASAKPTATWAPHWFVDPVDDSVHVLVSLQVSGTRTLYELHPTNEAMTSWSDPVAVGGTGFAGNNIDPDLTYWDGTYYLLYKDDDEGRLCLATSSSPFTGYTTAGTGDWAGWVAAVGGPQEAPQIVDIGTGWRLYFTRNSGWEASGIYYTETTDRTMASGWSRPTPVGSFAGYNHPLPITND